MKHGGKRTGAGRPRGQGQFGESTKPIRLPESMVEPVLKFVKNKGYKLPLYGSKVAAGSPAATDDHVEAHLDLNEYLVQNPLATFLVRVSGKSMIDAGIQENDILIVDRALQAAHGKIVIAAVDGQLTVKRLHKENNQVFLMPENKNFKPIEIKEGNEIFIWGVVTNVIHAI